MEDIGYPFNVLEDILEKQDDEFGGYDYSAKSIIKVMTDALTTREMQALECIYKNNMTLREAGEILGISRSRVGEIRNCAIRKLWHPNNLFKMRLVPYSDYLALEKELKKLKDYVESVPELEQFIQNRGIEDKVRLIDIDSIDLSVRSYNCLRRAGVKNVGDIIDKITSGAIVNIRNLGRRSANEVIRKVNELLGSDVYQLLD